jgi:hypothetical protein
MDEEFPEVTPIFADPEPPAPNRSRPPRQSSGGRPPLRFGVAVGPVPPEDPAPFDHLYGLLKSPSDRSNYRVSFYSGLPCFTVETPDYATQDPLLAVGQFEYNGSIVFLTKTEVEAFEAKAQQIMPEISRLVLQGRIDLSGSDSKFGLTFRFGSHVQALLFYAFLQCYMEGIVGQIEQIDFSHCKELDPGALQPLPRLFPNIRRITVIGTTLTKRPPKLLRFLEGIELIKEAGASAGVAPPLQESSRVAAEKPEEKGPPFPWLRAPDFAPRKCLSLEYFPEVVPGEDMSPGIRFVYEYLAEAATNPPGQRYAGECVFSVTAEHSDYGALALYAQVSTNCLLQKELRLIGRESVCAGLHELFPAGFTCKVMEIHEADLDVGMTVVGFHGVFIATGDGEVLGFDRTFILAASCGITNDHFVVRDPPPWAP